MSSCFGWRKRRDDETEPLLPQYRDDTTLQRELHQKLHSYQMIRALSQGYMPSTEQTIIQLRTLLAADILNPRETALSDSGRLLVRYTKRFLEQVIHLLQHKLSQDQIQDFLWYLSKSRLRVDPRHVALQASRSKVRADTTAAFDSLQMVTSLLLTNTDFRIFLADLSTTVRGVFEDTAKSVSKVADQAAKQIEQRNGQESDLAKTTNGQVTAPEPVDLGQDIAEVSGVVAKGTAQVLQDAEQSAESKLKGDEGQVMLDRLKAAVGKLRQRPDYNQSVSILSKIFQRLVKTYSRIAEDTANAVGESVQENAEFDRAVKNLLSLITSFGDPDAWKRVEEKFKKVVGHMDSDPEFERVMTEIANSIQRLLTDPAFLDNAQHNIKELKQKAAQSDATNDLGHDVEDFLRALEATIKSVFEDDDVAKLVQTSAHILEIVSPVNSTTNSDLIQDSLNVFIPAAIDAVQHVPIPRLEVSTPDADILLENLIIEPGKTINHSSFLPYKLRIETYNDLEIRKARFGTSAKTSHLVTFKVDGLSAKADEIGFWLRAHSGIFRLADQGIASFELDERGMDIHVDVEIAKERMESILSLKAVRVHIHKLNYHMRQSKFAWLSWLIKPLLRPILRKTMEKQIAASVAEFFHNANRELLFARERLRATRIADPQDLMTFFRAVAARLQPEEDPDVYTRIGIDEPGQGVFKGVYAPGSIAKIWHEEALEAAERIDEGGQARGWRNEIFDIHVTHIT